MRVLSFRVNGQQLKLDDKCDFTGIAKGTKGYPVAAFTFDWPKCGKAAVFTAPNGVETAVKLDGNNRCEIPTEVLNGDYFKVHCLGVAPEYTVVTNKKTIMQVR